MKRETIHPIVIDSHFKEVVRKARNLFMTVQPQDEYEVFTQIHQSLLLDNDFRGIFQKMFSQKIYRIISFKCSHCSQFLNTYKNSKISSPIAKLALKHLNKKPWQNTQVNLVLTRTSLYLLTPSITQVTKATEHHSLPQNTTLQPTLRTITMR